LCFDNIMSHENPITREAFSRMSKDAGISRITDAPYWKTLQHHEKGHMLACKLLARQILDDYNVTKGNCIDVGSGIGWLGLELAVLTDMTVHLVDVIPERLRRASENATEMKIKARVHIERADAERMPFQDNCADLIVCRGSVFFWKKPAEGFKEVYRILKPGRVAFMGGAIGRYMPKREREDLIASIKEEVRKLGPEREREWWAKRSPQWFKKWLIAAGIKQFKLIPDPPGMWVEIIKA